MLHLPSRVARSSGHALRWIPPLITFAEKKRPRPWLLANPTSRVTYPAESAATSASRVIFAGTKYCAQAASTEGSCLPASRLGATRITVGRYGHSCLE